MTVRAALAEDDPPEADPAHHETLEMLARIIGRGDAYVARLSEERATDLIIEGLLS